MPPIDPYVTESYLEARLKTQALTDDLVVENRLVGTNVLIRTVAFYYTGTVVTMNKDWIVLVDAAWIADTGRWSECLKEGTFSEVEPYPNKCYVAVGSVVDIAPWDHPLPREAK